MKIVAINEIHYTDKKGNAAVANPLSVLDIPKAEAELLMKGAMPAARRMTDAEIELDKLRAAAIANGAKASDEDDNEEDDKPGANANKPAASKSAVVKPGSVAAQSAKADAKTAAKGDAGGY